MSWSESHQRCGAIPMFLNLKFCREPACIAAIFTGLNADEMFQPQFIGSENMKKIALLVIVTTVFFGCQNPSKLSSSETDFKVPKDVAEKAEYPPKPTDFRADVKQYMASQLKDPDSAIYKNWHLFKAYIGSNPPKYGYYIVVLINAKNSFGGYTGFEHHFFFHRHGVTALPSNVHIVSEIENDNMTSTR